MLELSKRLALVMDTTTLRIAGERVRDLLTGAGCDVREVILKEAHPHADLQTAQWVSGEIRGEKWVVSVGSGTVRVTAIREVRAVDTAK